MDAKGRLLIASDVAKLQLAAEKLGRREQHRALLFTSPVFSANVISVVTTFLNFDIPRRPNSV